MYNYNIWPGNYGMYLEQIEANETSIGYWRVGSKEQPYGRFARGLYPVKEKTAYILDLMNDSS